jgi:hypothetical protein
MRSRVKRWLFESRIGDKVLSWIEWFGVGFQFHRGHSQLIRVRQCEDERIRTGTGGHDVHPH